MPDPVNPYIAGNPVTGEEMFFGRESVFAFVRQALTGQHQDNVIVLYGQRRTGKTSALYQMHRHLDARYICIFVDLHGLALEGIDGLLWELAHTVYRALRRDYQIDLPRLKRAEFMADARGTFKDEFLPQIWTAIGDRHILLMLDEAVRLEEQIHAGKLAKEIFEYLRHLMQHYERLNFLFALGSGLEEMEREYAFLFSVGLYKKISFLTRDAATALITRPAKDYYQIEPSAVDRIFNITSGHPYFTQLLCHSLFNHWQQQHQPLVRVDDVNAVVDEVVERGLAVLKQVWEDSSPGEKAMLAGMTAAMGKRNHPIGPSEIDRVWAPLNVTLPETEKVKAIRSLIARDVISGEDKYQFAVDLQRQWIQKYERLEWVKEEIAESVQQWQPPSLLTEQRQARRARTDRLAIAIILGFFVALIFFLIQGIRSLNESVDRERAYRLTLEAQVTRIAAAVATATSAADAPAATATAGAAALVDQQRTATALSGRCGVPATALDDLLARVNALRAQNGAAPLQLDNQLTALAQRHSDDVAAGASSGPDPNGIAYQACELNEAWTIFANDSAMRTTLLNPQYTQVGIGITSGPLSTFILKFALPPATDTSTPTPTPNPSPTRPTATPSPPGALDFDWTIISQGPNPANSGEWQIIVNILARGGDGNYQYFHDGLPVDGPRIRIVNRACRNKPGSFWVQDGTGLVVRKDYYLPSPYCLFPTPTP